VSFTPFGDFFEVSIGSYLANPMNVPFGAMVLLAQLIELWHHPWKRKPRVYHVAKNERV